MLPFRIRHSAFRNPQAGMAYVAILLLLVIMTTLGLAFLLKAGTEASVTMSRSTNMQTQYLAEAAANHAMWRLLNEPTFPASEDVYYMHSLAGGRYGYKVRRHTNTTFATIAAVGATGENVVQQSYVLYVEPPDDSSKSLLFVSGGMVVFNIQTGESFVIATAQEQLRIGLIESWGYIVTLISASATQADFDDLAGKNDVAYIPLSVNQTALGTRLRTTTIGVVIEKMMDHFGIATDWQEKSRDEIKIIDNSHYITSPFSVGLLTVLSSLQPMSLLNSGRAPGLTTLGEVFNVGSKYKPGLAVIDIGSELAGGGNAMGRRVQLPWGSNTFDFNALNADGQTIMKRAIKWAGDVPVAVNQRPTVSAGPDQTIIFPTVQTTLDGTVTDDGLPNPPAAVTTTWSKVSGPGTVTFDNASLVDTDVSFSQEGVYLLRLTADDSELTASDEVTITIAISPETYVNDIAMSGRKQGQNYYGRATVWIKDDGGNNVVGATVSVQWSGVVSGAGQGVTGSDGKIMLESPKKKNGGTFTCTVTNVVKSGYTYNPALNVETTDSINYP